MTDTEAKRRRAVGIHQPGKVLPVADGMDSEAERAALAGAYFASEATGESEGGFGDALPLELDRPKKKLRKKERRRLKRVVEKAEKELKVLTEVETEGQQPLSNDVQERIDFLRGLIEQHRYSRMLEEQAQEAALQKERQEAYEKEQREQIEWEEAMRAERERQEEEQRIDEALLNEIFKEEVKTRVKRRLEKNKLLKKEKKPKNKQEFVKNLVKFIATRG